MNSRFTSLVLYEAATYGAAEMTKEIVTEIKTDDLEIQFRNDSGYFYDDIIETIVSLVCKYLIKAKEYPRQFS